MKKLKRITAALATILMAFSSVNLCAAAETIAMGENAAVLTSTETGYIDGVYRLFEYRNYGDHIEITGLSNAPGKILTVPDEIDGLPVTTIGSFAIGGWITLREVVLPDTVTTIENCAFLSACFMESIVIPDSVTSIGSRAFSGCSALTSITLPQNLVSIGNEAFRGCEALNEISFPDSLRYIGEAAITGTPWYTAQPDGMVYAGKAVCGYKGDIPENTNLSFREDTQVIGAGVFRYESGIVSVTFPEGLLAINDGAFDGCKNLTEIHLPASLERYDEPVFSGCTGIDTIALEEDNPYFTVKDGILYTADFSEIKEIPYGSVSCEIPEPITEIPDYAFSGHTKLESVILPDTVTEIGNAAFMNCMHLQNIRLSEQLVSIGDEAFYNCAALTEISMPNTVTTVGKFGFYNCTSLKTLKFSTGITAIGSQEIYTLYDENGNPTGWCEINYQGDYGNCDSLTDVYYDGSQADWNAIDAEWRGNESLYGATKHFGSEYGITDMLIVQKYLTHSATYKNISFYDMNEDGCVNVFDLILIKQYLHA